METATQQHRLWPWPTPHQLAAGACLALSAGSIVVLLTWGWQDWQLLRSVTPTPVNLTTARPPSAGAGTQSAEVNAPATHLFGKPGGTPVTETQEAPETRLQLELRGIFRSSDADRSAALIAQQGQPAKLVYVGDALPGDGTLYTVQESRVLIRRQGRMESLSFASDRDAKPRSPAPQPLPTSSAKLETAAVPIATDTSYESDSIKERLQQLRQMQQDSRP